MPLTIQNIDEQFINVGTVDYDLSIAIGGSPDNVLPTGLFEGFYHDWDAANGTLHIKSDVVTRLVNTGIWTITAQKSGEPDVEQTIIYNVVPTTPVISDPGAQTIYKGGAVNLDIEVANNPSVLRASGLLTGMKWERSSTDEGADTILTSGNIPGDATLTEDNFDAVYYAENDGGSDEITVSFTISEIQIMVFHRDSRRLTGVNGLGNRVGEYTAPTGTYLDAVSGSDGVYLFNTSNRSLYKVNADLTLQWTYQAPSGADVDKIIFHNGAVYLLDNGNDSLYKVNRQGSLVWTFNATSGDYQHLFGSGDSVYIFKSGTSNFIQKINTASGERTATTDPIGSQNFDWSLTGAYLRNPIEKDGFIYAFNNDSSPLIGHSRRLCKFSAGDLSFVFSVRPESSSYAHLVFLPWEVDDDGHIYISDPVGEGRLYRFNSSTGNRDWRLSSSSTRLMIWNSVLYDFTNLTWYSRNRTTGAVLNSYTVLSNTYRDTVVFADDGIYVLRTGGFLKISDASLTQTWIRNISSSPNTVMDEGSPILDEGRVYAIRQQPDSVIAVNRDDGTVAWTHNLTSTHLNTYSQVFFFGSA